jgi:hypothetical protein
MTWQDTFFSNFSYEHAIVSPLSRAVIMANDRKVMTPSYPSMGAALLRAPGYTLEGLGMTGGFASD